MNRNPFLNSEFINLTNNRYSNDWVESSFTASQNSFGSSQYLNLGLSKKRLFLFLLFIIIGIVLLFGRSFYLQVIQNSYYHNLAEDNRTKVKYSRAQRGIIYDREGNILVRNISGFSLLITQADLPDNQDGRDKLISEVADIAGIGPQEIEERLQSAKKYFWQPVVIKTGISYNQAMKLKIESVDLPGVSLEVDNWRHYNYASSTAHMMGYVGKINAEEYKAYRDDYLLSDNIGKAGLEKYYESNLRGTHGEKRIEVDSFGREKKIITDTSPISGDDLVLTIDIGLQEKIDQILDKQINETKSAVVLVSNPQNGEILALVDYPSYNNNLFATGISTEDYQILLEDDKKPLFFRAIAGEYPSGSTIKQIVAAAALQERIVDRYTTFNSVGGLWYGGQWFFPDWRAGGHGLTNVIKAIADSVNTYFYYIGGGYGDFKGLGIEKLTEYMRLFGLGEKLGIDLPGEKPGLVPDKAWKTQVKGEPWYIGDTYHLAIGQGDILVTPLQVNSYTATVANGGKIYRPHLVKEIIYSNSDRKELIMPEIVRQDFISKSNLDIVREGMRQTVLSGSARSLSLLPVPVAGKTGTAQWHSQKENHAWFTAFAPYDKPTFAITVLVEEGGEGSSIAVPIARDILNYWFSERNNE